MTRNEIIEYLKDLGIEEPSKVLVSGLLNKFNEEKRNVIVETTDKIMSDIKDWKKPEEYQKVVDELNAEKGKGALAERKAKYQKANLNIEDEDILALVESKLKDSQKFDEELADYVKAHPSFLKATNADNKKEEQKQQTPQQKVVIGGAGSDKTQNKDSFSMQDAVKEYYSNQK